MKMKRSLVIGGGVGIGVLLILMAFPTVVNAQTTKMTINEKILSIQNTFNKRGESNEDGIIELIFTLIGGVIGLILIFLFFLNDLIIGSFPGT